MMLMIAMTILMNAKIILDQISMIILDQLKDNGVVS